MLDGIDVLYLVRYEGLWLFWFGILFGFWFFVLLLVIGCVFFVVMSDEEVVVFFGEGVVFL